MKLVLAAVLAAFLVGACTTPAPRAKDAAFTEETLNKDGTRVTVTKTSEVVHNEIVKEVVSRPLVKITCPPQGCILASFEVGQPMQGQIKDLIYQPKEPAPELHPAAQVLREIMQPSKDILLALGPLGLAARAGEKMFSTFGNTVTQMASHIQAPAGTSVAIIGSNGVGALGGTGSFTTSDRHDSTSTSIVTTTDNSQRWALDLMCQFSMTTGSPPAYCSQR